MKQQYSLTSLSCLFALTTLILVGCDSSGDRPNLGQVTGSVTLDGKPIADVLVRFEAEGFRASQGVTDAEGQYRLRYIRNIMGAAIGNHEVTISDSSGKKRVPKTYQTEPLKKVVEPGTNTIDIELTSGA